MKILISPGYGAGWSTWVVDRNAQRFSLTYQPLIDYIEEHGSTEGLTVVEYAPPGTPKTHSPLVQQFFDDLKAATGEEYFFLGGFSQLTVVEVEPPFKVAEYDGSESIEVPFADDWWTASDFNKETKP